MLQQPERDPNQWVAFNCRHCKGGSDQFIGGMTYVDKVSVSGYRRCWASVVCPHCLMTVMVSMGPPGLDFAVKELGAPVITLTMNDPDPVDVPWIKADDAIGGDEVLDFMAFMRDVPDEQLLEMLIGGEPA